MITRDIYCDMAAEKFGTEKKPSIVNGPILGE
jgi:hypothetical protein